MATENPKVRIERMQRAIMHSSLGDQRSFDEHPQQICFSW